MYAGFVRLPPRPDRPDKWGRFGLGAFHQPDNGLAGNLAGFCAGGIKIRKPLPGNSLDRHKRKGIAETGHPLIF